MREAQALSLAPDAPLAEMAGLLVVGVRNVAEAVIRVAERIWYAVVKQS